MKKWIVWIVAVLLALYIVVAGFLIAPARAGCYACEPDIHIRDSVDYPYVTSAEIRQLLLINHLLGDSVQVDSVRLNAMETLVESHPLVKKAEVSVLPSGYLRIDVEQRLPVMRILGEQEKFFIDQEGRAMKMSVQKSGALVDVPVVTGAVLASDSVLINKLYQFASIVNEDSFWDAMIEQVDVHSDQTMSLYLRLCDFEVVFGALENVEGKLSALRSFYQEALPKVGWDIYEKVSLEFDNQIVCTKKQS